MKSKKNGTASTKNIQTISPALRSWYINDEDINLDEMRVIGKGSFGRVYECDYNGTTVAAKTCTGGAKYIRQFERECSMYAIFNHPSIVRLLGVSLLSERPFVLLEFSPRGTLEESIVYGFSVYGFTMKNYLLSIIIEVTAALQHMQDRPQPVAHRDLKTENILLRSDMSCFLSDFGEAEVILEESTKLKSVGTPFYISPENLLGDEITTKSDMFSLAMIILELGSYYMERIEHREHFRLSDSNIIKPIQAVFSVDHHELISPAKPLNLIAEGWRPTFTKYLQEQWPSLCILIKNLWHSDPDQRPGTGEVLKVLSELAERDLDPNGEEEFLVMSGDLDASLVNCSLQFDVRSNLWKRRKDLEPANLDLKIFVERSFGKVSNTDFVLKAIIPNMTPDEVVSLYSDSRAWHAARSQGSNVHTAIDLSGRHVGILQKMAKQALPVTTASTIASLHNTSKEKKVYARYSISLEDIERLLLTEDYLKWYTEVKASELQLQFLELAHVIPLKKGVCELTVSITVDVSSKGVDKKGQTSNDTAENEHPQSEHIVLETLVKPIISQIEEVYAFAWSEDKDIMDNVAKGKGLRWFPVVKKRIIGSSTFLLSSYAEDILSASGSSRRTFLPRLVDRVTSLSNGTTFATTNSVHHTSSLSLGSGKIITPSLQARMNLGPTNIRGSLGSVALSLQSSDEQARHGAGAFERNRKLTSDKQLNIPNEIQDLMKQYKIAMKDLKIDVSSSAKGASCSFGKAHVGTLRGRQCECKWDGPFSAKFGNRDFCKC